MRRVKVTPYQSVSQYNDWAMGWTIVVRFLAWTLNFLLAAAPRPTLGPPPPPASYSVGTGLSFTRSKAAGARSWPLTII